METPAGQDVAREVAALRAEVEALAGAVRPLLEERERRMRESGGRAAGAGRLGRGGVSPAADALERRAREQGVSGLLSRHGYYGSANRSSIWSKEEQSAEELLGQDPVQVARVLAALAHPQRLQLLTAVLERPASAAELVERLGLGTTGQAYHHLNVLQAADLIHQAERGRFAFQPHRVQAFLTLLAGVSDALDPRHSAGDWEAAARAEEQEPQRPARTRARASRREVG